MLVVDETHRLLSMPEQYQSVFSVSKRTENVLLLSATPIQDRKEEYLNLLKLLLPAQYENMPMADFSKLLKNQEKIQRRVNRVMRDLSEFEDPDRQEEIFDLLDELAEMLDDKYLKRRAAKNRQRFGRSRVGGHPSLCFLYYGKLPRTEKGDPQSSLQSGGAHRETSIAADSL